MGTHRKHKVLLRKFLDEKAGYKTGYKLVTSGNATFNPGLTSEEKADNIQVTKTKETENGNR